MTESITGCFLVEQRLHGKLVGNSLQFDGNVEYAGTHITKHQTVHLRYENFTLCTLFLNLKKWKLVFI